VIQQRSEFGQQWFKILHAILLGDQDDYRNRQFRNVLLKFRVSIRCDEHVEFRGCKCKEFAVIDACPSLVADG